MTPDIPPAAPDRVPDPAPAPAPASAPPRPGRPPIDPDLAELAEACGVATSYVKADGEPVRVAADTVRAVLGLLGVDATEPGPALRRVREAPWRRAVPPCAVVPAATPAPVPVHGPAEIIPVAELELESGERVALGPPGDPVDRREIDGHAWVARPLALPAGLPLGDHVLHVQVGSDRHRCQVIAVPGSVPGPAAMVGPARSWGWMIQLYALSSAGSWGMGDYADLAALAGWSGQAGADVLLVNPLHASAPTLPVQPSPYSPASRRFVSPLYLRPEGTPEYGRADPDLRAAVDDLARGARRDGRPGAAGLLDRDAVWRAKLAALELLFAAGRADPGPADPGPANPGPGDPGPANPGPGDLGSADPGSADAGPGADLVDFATWCALAERHGPDWRTWPAGLRHPGAPAVAAARVELADRVAFHVWLQERCDQQLTAAQATARQAGMAAGIVHDLAVGVDPGGADAWALQDVLATGATVGAPPDLFNQQGQDWGLPPWRPDALAAAGYAPFRDMVASVLGRGGGLRVDHILGLFRLWWIPVGAGAAHGTYVRYDAEAMLGLIALAAARADAVVVGEDLGTVEPFVAKTLDRMGVLGSAVLWFEQDSAGRPLPPAAYRAATMASVTTHDLPTAAGYLEGEHVHTRARLGLLGRSEQAETAQWLADRDALIALLRTEGLLDPIAPAAADAADAVAGDAAADAHAAASTAAGPAAGPAAGAAAGAEVRADARASAAAGGSRTGVPGTDGLDPDVRAEIVVALHRLLVRSPSRIVVAAPGDALGDRFQPNLPGTVDAYPNWRLPVTDAEGRPVTLERLFTDPEVRRLGELLAEVRDVSLSAPGTLDAVPRPPCR